MNAISGEFSTMQASQLSSYQKWSILIGASVMLSLSMGMRQSFGLFQPSILHDTQITSADFSLATAIQNIMWGITQPFVGMFADRYGSRYVMLIGVLVYILGLVTMIFATTALAFTFGCGICARVLRVRAAACLHHDTYAELSCDLRP